MRNHILDNPISYYATYLTVRYLPVRLCYWLGNIVVLIVFIFSKKDRNALTFNLSLALDRPADDPVIRKLVRQTFINYGQYLIDFFLFPQLLPSTVKKFFAEIKGERILQSALAKGKGVIFLTAHVGNWEIGSSMLEAMNYPLAVVAMPHNTTATSALVNRLRKDKGIKVFEMNQSVFSGVEILSYLRKNGIVAMIGDKDFFGRSRPVSYFGQKVNFPIGPVVLALNSGASLIPAFILKRPDGRYFGVLEDPIALELEGDRNKIIDENLAKTARIFEKYIRSYPDQWYCPDPITGNAVERLP